MTYQLPDSAEVVVRYLLESGATDAPDEVFVTFEDGTTWTRRQGLEHAYAAANVLRAGGVRRDSRVAVFLPNGPDFLRAWWGTAVLGATLVPINIAYRGSILDHLMRLSEPVLAVGDPDLMARLDELTEVPNFPRLTGADLVGTDASAPELERPIGLWDAAVLLLTSGTTGPSKLAVQTYLHTVGGGAFVRKYTRGSQDTFLVDLPLFHGAAFWMASTCVATRTRMAVRAMPHLTSYWEIIRETDTTLAVVLSTMGPYLLSQPSRPAETEHHLRSVLTNPLPPDVEGFQKRFNIPELYVNYGMTEVPAPVACVEGDPLIPRYCGRAAAGFECRIVDENDIELGPDEPGEFVVRADQPWMIAPEYIGNPEATASAWRGGWFHTGDMLRRDAEGRFFFVDRIKDALRRRGENISSVELEAEIVRHPAVLEVSCTPYRPDDSTDDEVKAWILPVEGARIDFVEVLEFCVDRLPHFMVPRYFEVVSEFPRTASGRVKKFELRARDNDGAWDREAHGYTVTRNGLQRP